MVACSCQVQNGVGGCGLSGGERYSVDATFEGSDAVFQSLNGWVGEAGVNRA